MALETSDPLDIDSITINFLDTICPYLEDLDIYFIEAEWFYSNTDRCIQPLLGIWVRDTISNETSRIWIGRQDILNWASSSNSNLMIDKMLSSIIFDCDLLGNSMEAVGKISDDCCYSYWLENEDLSDGDFPIWN